RQLSPPANLVRVVGTSGRGSVSARLAAGLAGSGHVTGRFLSPPVESSDERVAVDGQPVSSERLVEFVATAREALARRPLPEELRPSFFELTLALALSEFAAAGVSHAVLEAGVGGASDATSAAARPADEGPGNLRLVVPTSVDPDHTDTLGATLTAIATGKAGAFAAGVPAVTAARGEALAAVRRVAGELGTPLHVDDGSEPLFA